MGKHLVGQIGRLQTTLSTTSTTNAPTTALPMSTVAGSPLAVAAEKLGDDRARRLVRSRRIPSLKDARGPW
jgi:hypothetical protein